MYLGKRMVAGQSAMVRKPRNKVSKACENCRRRKIKCTGKLPCNNCVTYQCECVYKNGAASAMGVAGQVKPNGSIEKLGCISSENTTESNGSEGEKMASFDCRRTMDPNVKVKNQSEAIFDPVQDCAFDSTEATSAGSSDTKPSMARLKREEKVGGCAGSAPRELGLASMQTLTPVEGDDGLYCSDLEFQEKISELQGVLKKLVSMRSPDVRIKNAIAELNDQVESMIDNWEPKYDFDKYHKSVKSGLDKSKSLETNLLKNKYSDQVFLTTYSVWTDTSKKNCSENPFFGNQPLVDELFGLYSPLQGLSLRGIGYFFQQCASGSESKEEVLQLKESLYLLLRFFDICLDQMNRSCVSIASPLESYLHRRNLMDCIPVSATNGVSPSNSNNRDLVSTVIDHLPQPFVERVTGVSNEQLHQLMYDDFAMFSLVLQMYNCHRKGFESLMMKMTERHGKNSPPAECSLADKENFIHFCKEEELLLALCYNYYNTTMYHVNECVANLNYFEVLLSLLETQKWLDEIYGFDKVLRVAISYAYDIGLSRWEYYVGLDEKTAERRRKCWWKLYVLEKLYCAKKGKQSSIDDKTMNCLLTAEYRNLGFSDNRDFLSKVTTTPRSWAFDKMSIQELKFYGECSISQVVSKFYSTVLYSERYTSIKNTAKPPFIRERLVNEVFDKLHELRSQFDAIKEQTKKLFEVASSSTDGSLNMFLSKDERCLAARYALFHSSFFFTISTSANNLIARLVADSNSATMVEHCAEYSSFLRESWRQMTQLVLALDDDYAVSRIFDSYGVVCLPLTSRMFCDFSYAKTLDDLILLLRVFKRLQNISIFRENKSNEYVASSKSYASYARFLTFLAINIHSMMLGYMRINTLSKDKLFENVKGIAPDVADLPPLILNAKSAVYEPLMEPVQTSGFHLKVCSMLERDGKYTKGPKQYPKTALQLMPTSNHDLGSARPLNSEKALISTRENGTQESPYPHLPFIRSPTDVHRMSGSTQVSENPSFANAQQLKHANGPEQDQAQQYSPGTLEFPYKSYNLGTLDEFINKGDLNDLCNTLWSDLYSDEVPQSVLFHSDFGGAADK